MSLKETLKEKIDEGKEKVKETKAYRFYKEHEKQFKFGGAMIGLLGITAINGRKQYKKGVKNGFAVGMRENALRQRDKVVMNMTLDYIDNAGEDGATFETDTGRKVVYKRVSEIREI